MVAALGVAVAGIDRTQEGVYAKEQAAGIQAIFKGDVAAVIPGIAQLQAGAQIGRQQVEVVDAAQVDGLQQAEVLTGELVLFKTRQL